MNQRIKELWINALRSGEYKQSHHALRMESGYCCLGVLCDIASKDGIGKWTNMGAGRWAFGLSAKRDTLPVEVMEWAGLYSSNPDVDNGSLARNNDSGATFGQIAELIQTEL